MLSISLYCISIVTQNFTSIVRDIIFIRAVTHSISETSIFHRATERTSPARKAGAGETRKGGGREEEKEQEKTRGDGEEARTASDTTAADTSLSP